MSETKEVADSTHDPEALNRFTSGRWLWNEEQQLACRYVKFDLSTLLKVAASTIGSTSCVEVTKISEGQYNKVLQLTMNDGRCIIAKLPNPNAGRPHFTTASEVATMDFLRNVLNLPVPKVYAYSSRASKNPVGAEYILMEKQAGVVLTDVWETMTGKQKAKLLDQIIDVERRLAATRFLDFGSLYYKADLPHGPNGPSLRYLDSTGSGSVTVKEKFAMGPTNHRSFFDFGRDRLHFDRGPWSTVTDYMTAIAQREIATAKAGLQYPLMPEGLFRGPRQYQPSLAKKLAALNNYVRVAHRVLPENRATHASVLWHGDLHSQNVFVASPEDPGRVVGIIDWQSVSACPLFMQAGHPAFLAYDGPAPEDLGRVPLPANFDSLAAEAQREAKALHRAQTLYNLYLVRSLQLNETAFRAIEAQNSLRHRVSVVPGLVLMDYEPLLHTLLRDVDKELGLSSIPSSEEEILERDADLWAQGVALMDTFVRDTGFTRHWDGRVADDGAAYERARRQLDHGVARFLDREARNEQERQDWLRVLPFVD